VTDRRFALGRLGKALAGLALPRTPKADVGPPPFPRPPGALTEAAFLDACTRCDACMDACPHGSIGRIPSGRLEGTPAMLPNEVACHLCPDTPCITACEPGALVATEPHRILLGFAEIQEASCFTFQGPECGACKPACPTGAVVMVGLHPTIDDAACTGCGLCREACPVWDKAILIVH